MTTPLLGRLQALDTDIDRTQGRLVELDQMLAERALLDEAEASASLAGDAAGVQRRQLRERESELKALETRIAELDQKLYSGRIRNPKELEGFEREARMFKQNQGKLEEAVLGLMDEAERTERDAQGAQAKLEMARAERAQAEAEWKREAEALRAHLAAREKERGETRAQLSEDDLRVYDRQRKRTALAVAPLRGQRCGACKVDVSTEVLERAGDESALAQCGNCNRILIVE